MSMYTYTLDPQAAKQGDGGQTIDRLGKYIGVFTKAEHVITDKGTVGISFDFEASTGETASFALYTRRTDGSTIFGYNQLQAIMACFRLRELAEPQNKTANVWDKVEQKRTDKAVPQFTELLNKPIGILFVMEEYKAGNGDYKWRPSFSHAFCAETELMASEILDKKTVPERLPKVLQGLKDKPVKDKSTAANPFNTSNPQSASKPQSEINPPPADYDNSDIPF